MRQIGFIIGVFFLTSFTLSAQTTADPLPSWQEGKVKQRILHFVQVVTNPSSPDYVTPENRIAAIDNDGTLWLEQPLYTQVIYTLSRVKALAQAHPEWKKQQPFSAVITDNRKEIAKFNAQDFERLLAATHSGMTVDNFDATVKQWLAEAKNSRYQRQYTALIYQPMLEVLNYLRAQGFKIYIVTGGGQDFVRAFSKKTYDILPENVIGSASKTQFQSQNATLIKMPQILFIDDKAGKPEAIHLVVGRKPIIAFGNSDGDREMLEWTQAGSGKRLMLLVHHDDAKREYAYGPESKVGTFSNSLMKEAKEKSWEIISMKNDWKVIFPFEIKK